MFKLKYKYLIYSILLNIISFVELKTLLMITISRGILTDNMPTRQIKLLKTNKKKQTSKNT
jgi:hypothetical protein